MKQKNLFGSSVEYSEGRDYIQDFKLMKRCRHFIVGNSSYSAMAAILGEVPDKRVVAPRPGLAQSMPESLARIFTTQTGRFGIGRRERG